MEFEKPRYTHDCTACVYLGQHGDYDLYWCANPRYENLSSMLFRYSDEGSKYRSSHPPAAFAGAKEYWLNADDAYKTLMRRAIEKGLYTKEALCRGLTKDRRRSYGQELPIWYEWEVRKCRIHLEVTS